jgi:hypothetical protein
MSRLDRPVVLAITSDQHCGSTVALCPPSIALDDGGTYHASKAQLWLYQKWLKFWEIADETRRGLGADLYGCFLGDFTDGDHHGTTQILSGNPTAQAAVVNAAMAPVLDLAPDRLFFVRGTEAHVGKSAAFEERIALGLQKDGRPVVGDPATGTASWWHLRMEVQGVRFDFAHHGRFGQRPWTRGNIVLNYAAEIFYDHAAAGVPHPHVAIRGHQHRFFDTAAAHPTRVIQLPCWQFATAFIHKINPGALPHIGGLLVIVDGGVATVKPVMFTPDPAPAWTPSA